MKSTFLCPKDSLIRLVHENVRIESHTSMNSRAEWNGYKVSVLTRERKRQAAAELGQAQHPLDWSRLS